MDLVGLLMGVVTIPMAILTVASVLAGLLLLATGGWSIVLAGLLAFALCLILAVALEQLVILIDDAAALAKQRLHTHRASWIAVASGALPMMVVLGWEYGVFRTMIGSTPPAIAVWLWSYGIATGPWTLFSQRVSRFRRTLCGIRAYAGHLAYWLLSIAVIAFGAAPPLVIAAMALPAILPFVVGLLLAVADRDALTNVRV